MNKCETCGGLHYRLDPCRVPKKSRAVTSVKNSHLHTQSGFATTFAGTVVDKDRQLTKRGNSSQKSTVRKNMPVRNGVSVAERVDPGDSAPSAKRPVDTHTDQKQDASDSLGSGPTIASAKAPVTKQLSKASLANTDGSDPLKQTRPARFDKTAYQRSYMRGWRKRQRDKRDARAKN